MLKLLKSALRYYANAIRGDNGITRGTLLKTVKAIPFSGNAEKDRRRGPGAGNDKSFRPVYIRPIIAPRVFSHAKTWLLNGNVSRPRFLIRDREPRSRVKDFLGELTILKPFEARVFRGNDPLVETSFRFTSEI